MSPGPLNFTGRPRPPETVERPEGSFGFILACLALAALALLAGVVVYAARRLDRPATAPVAPLAGISDPASAAAAAATPAPTPAPGPAPRPVEGRTVPAAAPEARPAPRASARSAPGRAGEPALTPAQARFVEQLRRAPGAVTLYVDDDAEAQASARLLTALFERGGWRVDRVRRYGSAAPLAGFSASLGDGPQGAAVAAAFAGAGIRLAGPQDPAGIERAPAIYVGRPR